MFDELLNYEEFEQHEWRAFYEEVICKDIDYKIIAFTDKGIDKWGSFTKVFVKFSRIHLIILIINSSF